MTTETTTETTTIEVHNPSFFSKARLLHKYYKFALGYHENGGEDSNPIRFAHDDGLRNRKHSFNFTGMNQTLEIIEAVYGESGVAEAKKIEKQIARDFKEIRAEEAKERD